MRTAFCIFGQIREEGLSFPQIESIARANDAEIFMSVWDRRGAKITGALWISQLSRIFGPEVGHTVPRVLFDRIYEAFPDLERSLKQTFATQVTRGQLEAQLPTAHIEVESGSGLFEVTRVNHSDVNSLRMLYKMWRSYLMMKAYERSNAMRFDQVALFRPDIIPPATIPVLAPNTLATYAFHPGFVHDMFMLADAATIDVMVGVFGKCAMNASRLWQGIHRELYDQAVENGIQLEHVAISAGITDSAETQAIGRGALRGVLATHSIDPDFQPAISDGAEVIAVLRQTIEVADRTTQAPTYADILAVVRADPAGSHATEAAFSLCGFLAEHERRYDLAFLAETCRIVAALLEAGIAGLDKLRECVLTRWTYLAQQAGSNAVPLLKRYTGSFSPEDEVTGKLVSWLMPHYNERIRSVLDFIASSPTSAPPNVDDLIREMNDQLRTGDRHAAQAAAARTLELFPDSWKAFDAVGHYYSKVDQHATALDCAQRAMELEGTSSWGFVARIGCIYADLGELSNARHYLQRAANLPDGDDAKRWLVELGN